VRAAYLMVKSCTEEDLTSCQQFIEALQFAGKVLTFTNKVLGLKIKNNRVTFD